jgi:hypothetical protein
MLAGAAATFALAGLSLALGSPGFAQPDAQKQEKAQPRTEHREVRTIIRTIHDGDGEAAAHREHSAHGEGPGDHQRVIVMNHRGGAGQHDGHTVRVHGPNGEVVIPDCDGGQATNVDETTGGERTRVILCTRGEATPAQRAERLQRARDRLANDSELSAEQRTRVTAALDRQIAQLRGQ